jgi:hypothetical protein
MASPSERSRGRKEAAVDAVFFATVIASDRVAMRQLMAYNFYLVDHTASVVERQTTRLSRVIGLAQPAEHAEARPPHFERLIVVEGLLNEAEAAAMEGVSSLSLDGGLRPPPAS